MNLTLMIATKDRPEFLSRTLEYYSIANFEGKILIGDSSDKYNSEKNISKISDLKKKINIEYFIDTKLSSDQMILFLSKKVTTDYSVMINDDDILILSSIEPCLKFLDQNLDYSGVNGNAFNLAIDNNSAKPYGKITLFNKYPLANYIDENPLIRIFNYFDNTLNVNMSIIRSEVNLQAFVAIENLNKFDSSYVFGELIHASVVLSKGKIGSLDGCYLIRQKHEGQHYRNIKYDEWIKKSNFIDASTQLKNIIIKEIEKYENLTTNDISKIDQLISQKIKSVIQKMINLKNRYLIYKFKKFFSNIIFLIKTINLEKNSIQKIKPNYANHSKIDQNSIEIYLNLITQSKFSKNNFE